MKKRYIIGSAIAGVWAVSFAAINAAKGRVGAAIGSVVIFGGLAAATALVGHRKARQEAGSRAAACPNRAGPKIEPQKPRKGARA